MTDISELVQKIKSAAEKATPGKWMWWTSNSFLRLSSDATAKDGGVIDSYRMTDGHTSLRVSKADQDFIALACPENIRALTGALDRQKQYYESVIADGSKRIAELEARLSPADKIHDSEANAQPSDAIGVFRVGSKSDQEPPVVLTEAVKNLPEGVYWLYATHQPTPGQRQEWMARGAVMSSEQLADIAKSLSPGSSELIKSAARACFILASRIRSGEVDL